MCHASLAVSVLAVVPFGLMALNRFGPTAGQSATSTVEPQGFVGSWWVRVTPAQRPPELSLGTIAADGTAVTAGPPVAPRPGAPGEVFFRSAGHGVWKATGPDMAILTFAGLATDELGNLFATANVRARLTLSADGQAFSGEGVRTIFDPDGNPLATDPLTVEATRIVLEAPASSKAGMPAP